MSRIGLVCLDCLDKFKDWQVATLCNVHYNNGFYSFQCLNCGRENTFPATVIKGERIDKRSKELLREKLRIQNELANKETKKIN